VVQWKNGKLAYPMDGESNRVPDYSYAGFKAGETALPTVAEVARLEAAGGDNTARIQQALDAVGARTPDANGLRGALVLGPGTWEIKGTVKVLQSGVVLRGSGNGSDPAKNTVLHATGNTPDQRPVVNLGASASWSETGAKVNVTTAFVPVGSFSFEVADGAAFKAGDAVVVKHPSSQAWIDAIGGGGPVESASWAAGSNDIEYFRRVTAVAGNKITLDVPVYNHLDKKLTQCYVAHAAWKPVTLSGVENLRVDIQTLGGEDEAHAWSAVNVTGAENAWVKGVVALHWGYAGVKVESSVRVTVADCQSLEPVAIRTGARMYNFSNDRRSQQILFVNCLAANGRHGYISNGVSSSSGLVYYKCKATSGGASEGGHRRWVTGVLYDNIVEEKTGQITLINRGDMGTSHGWGTAHSTIWKYNSELMAQKPPTAQNYGITNAGHFRTNFYFPGAAGVNEMKTGDLFPASLYEAQLCERLGAGTAIGSKGGLRNGRSPDGDAVAGRLITFYGGGAGAEGWAALNAVGSDPESRVRLSDLHGRTAWEGKRRNFPGPAGAGSRLSHGVYRMEPLIR
jgi:hypothetical protein